jgi:hypothetical protein
MIILRLRIGGNVILESGKDAHRLGQRGRNWVTKLLEVMAYVTNG